MNPRVPTPHIPPMTLLEAISISLVVLYVVAALLLYPKYKL